MKWILATIGFMCMSVCINAQNVSKAGTAIDAKLSPGAALLFKNVKTGASIAEQNRLFKELNLKLAADKKSFVMDEYDVEAFAYPTDMNGDGLEELFVTLGSVALFGNTAQSFTLYISDNTGKYQPQTDPGGIGIPIILTAKSSGYPDILIGGPGFEFPVYRWNGRKYALHRKMKDGALNGNNSSDVGTYSKAYTASK